MLTNLILKSNMNHSIALQCRREKAAGAHARFLKMSGHLEIVCGSSAQDAYFQARHIAESEPMVLEELFDDQLLLSMICAESLGCGAAVCASAPVTWPHGYHPPCTDYYTESLASSSPTHSFSLPSPADYSSYTPPESHSSSSSCYSSPTRMDMGSSFPSETYHYQHCTVHHCFCMPHWPGLQDGTMAADYTAAHCSTSDCSYQALGEDVDCTRESPSSQLCYL